MLTSNLNKIVLCATANNLVAGLWYADKLQRSEVFLNTEEGHRAFASFLQEFPATHVYLLANAVEEDYRLESLPHITGRAKKELIDRKLNQFYRDLVYRSAHFIMREKDKRKDDQYLFVALNNDDFLQNWMNIIQQLEAHLVGVYLLPMLNRVLVQDFKLEAPHILLCEMLSSGLRQTYFHNGRLRMSRLIPNVPTDETQLSYFYVVETQKTRLYLMSKRFISRDVTLNLQIVSLNNQAGEIKKNFEHETGIDCDIIKLSTYAKSLNLNMRSLKVMPELLHMHLLASGHKVDNFAPESLTKSFKLSKISRWLKNIAIVLGISGALISAWFFIAGFQHQTNFDEAKQATQLEQLRYNEVAKSFPQTVISAEDLKTAVTFDKKLSSLPKSPRRMMITVSAALEPSPEIVLTKINWLQTNDFNAQDNDEVKSANDIKSQAVQSNNTDPTRMHEIGFVSAEIAEFDGNYRHAMQLVNLFVDTLKQDPSVVHVKILQKPVNLNSYTDLRGNTKDAQLLHINQDAAFKVKVILNPSTEGGQ